MPTYTIRNRTPRKSILSAKIKKYKQFRSFLNSRGLQISAWNHNCTYRYRYYLLLPCIIDFFCGKKNADDKHAQVFPECRTETWWKCRKAWNGSNQNMTEIFLGRKSITRDMNLLYHMRYYHIDSKLQVISINLFIQMSSLVQFCNEERHYYSICPWSSDPF